MKYKTNNKYSLRDFFTEEGKSLRCEYNYYHNTFMRYREMRVCSSAMWFLFKKMYRINGWHKLDILHKRIGKGYCASNIWDAEFPHRDRILRSNENDQLFNK